MLPWSSQRRYREIIHGALADALVASLFSLDLLCRETMDSDWTRLDAAVADEVRSLGDVGGYGASASRQPVAAALASQTDTRQSRTSGFAAGPPLV